MNLKAYINFVELPTKVASVIPFMVGVVYTLYRYGDVNVLNLTIMFISMITFDMSTTAINNYCDYQNEIKHMKEKYSGRNPMHVYNISNKIGLVTIASLLAIATILGIILTFKTNLLLLVIGAVCFFVGIFYTFGPIPISRMPLGEIFSGTFMGLLITFLTIYVSIYDRGYFGIYIQEYVLRVEFNIIELLILGITTVPLVTGIANIMLANNTCDLEEDIKVGRYTLPYYIGKSNSVKLFKLNYYIGYIAVILGISIGVIPTSAIVFLLTILIVNKNIKRFEEIQIKSKTFILSVQNFIIIGLSYTLGIGLSLVI